MNSSPSPSHFKGKTAQEHLKKARMKGMIASSEIHGIEMSGSQAAFADSLKDTALALLALWSMSISLFDKSVIHVIMILFSISWIIWKPARSAILGWGRLERLHRLIEEERWEIEHNREQERLELTEMYQAKGFSGRLLEESVDVLMSDDNRLLQVMLEEELGLTLEVHEHPLKQAFAAFLGSSTSTGLILLSALFLPKLLTPAIGFLLVSLSSILTARLERNKKTSGLIWNLSSAAFVVASTYLLGNLFSKLQ
ncbi:MAG: hypothetical protein EBZ47_01415 [Chlamydiae bacterium]|nr:hypothetical protein [Chlamydiota bacterium]